MKVTPQGELKVIKEGKERKFLRKVDQITFSGKIAQKLNKNVFYFIFSVGGNSNVGIIYY